MPTPIPLLMSLEFLEHLDDDRMEHYLQVGVIGVDRPITADIESDFYKNPRITNLHGNGLDVPAALEEAFLLKCFNLLWPDPCGMGTAIRELFLDDATAWIKAKFSTVDAHNLLTALRHQVTPDLVKPGDRYSSMIPVHLPIEGDHP